MIQSRSIEYSADGATLRGHFAFDDAATGPVPAIAVVHEWWGIAQHPRNAAERLAGQGWAAMAIDMFGGGRCAADVEEAGRFYDEVRPNLVLMAARFNAGIQALAAQPEVDPSRIGAMGFCFGGTVCLEMARMGAELAGVASFHGALGTETTSAPAQVATPILVCHGAEDPMVPPDQVMAFQQEMRAAGADWQFISYGGAMHAFTNPTANRPGLQYNEPAARRSWAAMTAFFSEQFNR